MKTFRCDMHDIPDMTVEKHHMLCLGVMACCFEHVPFPLKAAIMESLASAKEMGLSIQPNNVLKQKSPAPCDGGCNHSTTEHRSFDQGVMMGRTFGIEAINPYSNTNHRPEWDAFECGKSAGIAARP